MRAKKSYPEIAFDIYESIDQSDVKKKKIKSSDFWGSLFRVKRRTPEVVERIKGLLTERHINVSVDSGKVFGTEENDDSIVLTPWPLKKDAIYWIFNDKVMLGLIIILAFVAIILSFFDNNDNNYLSPGMMAILKSVNYIVILAFISEYLLKLYVEDKSKISFISNPLHVLDLFIIIIALSDIFAADILKINILDFFQLSFVPQLTTKNDYLLLLRLPLRLLLVLALTRKAKEEKRKVKDKRKSEYHESIPCTEQVIISTLDEKGNYTPCSEELNFSFEKDSKPLWVDIQNIREEKLKSISEKIDISHEEIKRKLIDGSFPRIDYIGELPSILLLDSRIEKPNDLSNSIDSSRMLVVLRGAKIITLTTDESELFTRLMKAKIITSPADNIDPSNRISIPAEQFEKRYFAVNILYLLLKLKIEDYGKIVQEIERKTDEFERSQMGKTSTRFIHQAFLFKKEIQQISDNLWHFHQVLDQIINKKDVLHLRINQEYRRDFNALHSESKYICRTARNIKDSLGVLIDLHVSTVSFDINRVMKVIAVLPVLP